MSFVLLLSLSSHTHTHTAQLWLSHGLLSHDVAIVTTALNDFTGLAKPPSFTALISRTTHWNSYYKNQNTFEKKTSSMPVIFYLSNKFPFLLICLFLSLFDVQTRTKHTDQIPPSPDPTCVVKGARGIQSWRVRFPIERHHFDMPRVCWQQQNPKLGERTTRLSCSPFLFIHFSPSFFLHTHTQRHEKVLSLFLLDRFWFFCHFFEHFQTTEKTKKLLRKKNAQTKTHLLYTTTTTTSLSNLVAAFFKNYFIFSLLKRFHPQTNILRLFFSLSHTHTENPRTPSPITNADDVMFSLPNALWCAAALLLLLFWCWWSN